MKKMVGLILITSFIINLEAAQANLFTKKTIYINNQSTFVIMIDLKEQFLKNTLTFKELIEDNKSKLFQRDISGIEGIRITLFKNKIFFTSVGFGTFCEHEESSRQQLEIFNKIELTKSKYIFIEIIQDLKNQTLKFGIKNLSNNYAVEQTFNINELEGKMFTCKDIGENIILN